MESVHVSRLACQSLVHMKVIDVSEMRTRSFEVQIRNIDHMWCTKAFCHRIKVVERVKSEEKEDSSNK